MHWLTLRIHFLRPESEFHDCNATTPKITGSGGKHRCPAADTGGHGINVTLLVQIRHRGKILGRVETGDENKLDALWMLLAASEFDPILVIELDIFFEQTF